LFRSQRSWDASILLFLPNDGSQLRKGIYLDFGFTRLIGTETAKRWFRNGQGMIQVKVVVVGRSRESRTREAAGRRNKPEAVPKKMSGIKGSPQPVAHVSGEEDSQGCRRKFNVLVIRTILY